MVEKSDVSDILSKKCLLIKGLAQIWCQKGL